jgi:hypothetical protein
MGVTEWQSSLGELRQGTEIVLVLYRQRPASLLVPIPPTHWHDASALVDSIMQIRDGHLKPSLEDKKHTWVQETYTPTKMNIVDGRRNSAILFGTIMRGTPVILTFYDYDSVLMLPVPPELPTQEIETIHNEIQTFIHSSDAS